MCNFPQENFPVFYKTENVIDKELINKVLRAVTR